MPVKDERIFKRTEKVCDQRATKAEKWRGELLAQVRLGVSVFAACDKLGIQRKTYQQARVRHPAWAAEITAAWQTAKSIGFDLNDLEDPAKRETLAPDHKLDLQAQWMTHYLKMTHHGHQLRLIEALEATGPGELCLILCAPESGKSTSVLNWATHRLSLNPNERICLVSESQDLTRKFVGRLKNRFTDASQFPELISTYGPFFEQGQSRDGSPWAADFFRVARCSHDEADYSVQARAWKSSAYGQRIDTLIIDDVQSRKSLNQTQEIYDNLRQTYFTRGKAMRTIIVGSRAGAGDIYERMIDDDIVDRIIQLPAMDADGDPTCTECWNLGRNRSPKEHLEAKKKLVGARAWHSAYQQQPQADELSTFASYIEQCLDNDRAWGELGKWAS